MYEGNCLDRVLKNIFVHFKDEWPYCNSNNAMQERSASDGKRTKVFPMVVCN
jgi:hypothetical protein